MTTPLDNSLLTAPAAARLIGCCPATVLGAARRGELATVETDGKILRFDPEAVRDWANQFLTPPAGWLSATEACEALGVHRWALAAYQGRDWLHPFVIGKRKYFDPRELETLLNSEWWRLTEHNRRSGMNRRSKRGA